MVGPHTHRQCRADRDGCGGTALGGTGLTGDMAGVLLAGAADADVGVPTVCVAYGHWSLEAAAKLERGGLGEAVEQDG